MEYTKKMGINNWEIKVKGSKMIIHNLTSAIPIELITNDNKIFEVDWIEGRMILEQTGWLSDGGTLLRRTKKERLKDYKKILKRCLS